MLVLALLNFVRGCGTAESSTGSWFGIEIVNRLNCLSDTTDEQPDLRTMAEWGLGSY